jgi:hypothetical protein
MPGRIIIRTLSESFMHDLLDPAGLLSPILTRVKMDQTLMLAIRENSINIYYRGGNLLRISEKKAGNYQAYFDSKYNHTKQSIPTLPVAIKSQADALQWVYAFPILKQTMDFYFSAHPKPEREFQQLIARENNDSSISNESEYFISDIETADSKLGARFDMMAVRWRANQRKDGSKCKPAFIEVKYADGALGGSAGLLKHLEDMDAMIADTGRYSELLQTMESQFDQLDRLGLLNFNKGISNACVKLNPDDKPEAIFILANHNPRSTKLKTILGDPEIDAYAKTGRFDLKFFVASFSGYGLHSDCMLSLVQFCNML